MNSTSETGAAKAYPIRWGLTWKPHEIHPVAVGLHMGSETRLQTSLWGALSHDLDFQEAGTCVGVQNGSVDKDFPVNPPFYMINEVLRS